MLVVLPELLYHRLGAGIGLSRAVLAWVLAVAVAWLVAVVLEQLRSGRGALAHQHRVNEAVLDGVDVGLVLLDEDGRYVQINRRHQEFMAVGFPDGHAGFAGGLGEVFHEDAVTGIERDDMPTSRAMRGEEFDDQLIWIGSERAERRALSVSARTVRDGDGGFAGAALAYKDVTDLVRALQVKEEFIALVSHELRTPLTSIHGFTALVLERDDLPEDAVHQLQVVSRNVDRLDRLVGDLLQTAQTERGTVDVVRRPTDLAALVRDCVEAARPALERAGLSLETHLPERLEVSVDPQRTAQVVDNLVSNAVKYTRPDGRVEVCLGVADGGVELEVRDTGIGISPRDCHQVFSRFFRSRHVTEQSIQGVGLGLSICKAIVESHGGRIEVESAEGVGSTFRVRLPYDAPTGD
nr:PAS domain-containing sensor histidine kinase [Nocardioides flavescens]